MVKVRTASWSRQLGTVPIIKLMGVPGSGSGDRDHWTEDTHHHNPVGVGSEVDHTLPTIMLSSEIILPRQTI